MSRMGGEYCIGRNCYCSANASLTDASFPALPSAAPPPRAAGTEAAKISEPLLYPSSKELARAARIDEADADVILALLDPDASGQLDLSLFKAEDLKDIITTRLELNGIEAAGFEGAVSAVVSLRERHLACMVDASAGSAIKPAACEDGTYYHLKSPFGLWQNIDAKDGFVRLVIDKRTFKSKETENYISALGNETVFSENYSGRLFVAGDLLGIEQLTMNPLGILEGVGSTTEEIITFVSALLLIIGHFGGKKVRGMAPQYGLVPAFAGNGVWRGEFRYIPPEAFETAPVIRLGRGTAAAFSAGGTGGRRNSKVDAKPPAKVAANESPISGTATTIEMQAVKAAQPPPLPRPLPPPLPPPLPKEAPRPPNSTVFMPAVKEGEKNLGVTARHERALMAKLGPTRPTMGRNENAWPPLTGIVKDPSRFKGGDPLPGQFEKDRPRAIYELSRGTIAGGREGYFDTSTYQAGRAFGYTVGGAKKNQDAVGFASSERVFFMTVADGVGGGPRGDLAAESLVISLTRYVGGRPAGDIVSELSSIGMSMPSVGVPPDAQTTFAGVRIVNVRGMYYAEIITVGDSQALIARPGKGLVFYTQPQTLAFFNNRDQSSAIERTMGEFTEDMGKRETIATSVASGQMLPRKEINVSRLPLCQNDIVAIYSDGIGKNFTPWMLARFLIDPRYSVGALGRSLARSAWDAMNAGEVIISAGNYNATIGPTKDNFSFGITQITAPTAPIPKDARIFLDPVHEYLLK